MQNTGGLSKDIIYTIKLLTCFCPFVPPRQGFREQGVVQRRFLEFNFICWALLEYVTILGDQTIKVSCLNGLLRTVSSEDRTSSQSTKIDKKGGLLIYSVVTAQDTD